jgi:hypothetical protein
MSFRQEETGYQKNQYSIMAMVIFSSASEIYTSFD